jgi:MYXO-CTERM domain-containing protein
MRFRHALTVAVLTVAGTLPLAGAAYAQPDRDCADFASQAEAQEALDGSVGDPERLDANDDGVACESYFREAAATTRSTPEPSRTSAPEADEDNEADETKEGDDVGQVKVLPQGGVDTGDGSTDEPAPTTALIALAGMGLLAVGVRRARQDAS